MEKILCPLCGSENPPESKVCQVCNANLTTLPSAVFPARPEPQKAPAKVKKTVPPTDNSKLPDWILERMKEKKSPSPSFNNYLDAIFSPDNGEEEQEKAEKTPPARKRAVEPKKKENVPYQPSFPKFAESPLVEPDPEAETETDPADDLIDKAMAEDIADFSQNRPARKWDDEDLSDAVESISEDDSRTEEVVKALGDSALIEADENDESAKSVWSDPIAENSVSLSKLPEAEEFFDEEAAQAEPEEEPEPAEETKEVPEEEQEDASEAVYQPELDLGEESLVSDLLNSMDEEPEPALPNLSEGVIFSSTPEEEPEESLFGENESVIETEADVLDRILRQGGFVTEDEAAEESEPEAEPEPEDDSEAEKTPSAPAEEESFNYEEDNTEEEPTDSNTEEDESILDEIPWNLFDAGDVILPQYDEDNNVKTFSRDSVPGVGVNQTYRERMVSVLLEKVVRSESSIRLPEKDTARRLSLWVKTLFFVLAFAGVLAILLTGFTDSYPLPAIKTSPAVEAFTAYTDGLTGKVMIVTDYSPSYADELDPAAERLLSDLNGKDLDVSMAIMGPASAMIAENLRFKYSDRIPSVEYFPGNALSIQEKLTRKELPETVILVTSNLNTVQTWADQLYPMEDHDLAVIASAQLSPLLEPYRISDMIRISLSEYVDLSQYADKGIDERAVYAVWYLCLLAILSWLIGCIGKYLSADPVRKRPVPHPQYEMPDDMAGRDWKGEK